MTFLVMAALVIGSTSVVFAADEINDTVKSTLITTAEGLTDTIVQLKDEEIENYMSSGNDFTISAMQSWQTSKDELGAKKDSNGETTVLSKMISTQLLFLLNLRKQKQTLYMSLTHREHRLP